MKVRDSIHKILTKGPLLFDGATGTYARSIPAFPDGPVELACISAPDAVIALHSAYLNASCRMIKTNTFAAHPGLAVVNESQQKEIIAAAYDLAIRAASPHQAFVFADIGPVQNGEEPVQAYMRAADCFLALGAECFLFETMSSCDGLIEAAEYIRKRNPDAFIAISFAADPDGFTRSGEYVKSLIMQMDACCAVDAVGLNCVCGAYHMRRLIQQIGKTTKLLMAMPNSGYPHLENGRIYYDSDPAYFAQQVNACAQLGVSIVGGCCGTTPAHIEQLSRLLSLSSAQEKSSESETVADDTVCKSRILKKLKEGKRPVLVELDPPRNAQLGGFLEGAKRLTMAGADAITIADCPIGRARMDSSLLACKLSREYGIEAMPHMTCRDRNVNAAKALLLGLSMEGVHNVLAVTGDPVPTADRDSVKSVFQLHSRVFARFVTNLCQSGEAEPFFLCGALNVNAINFNAELEKAKQKEKCGVQAFLTQPILSERAAQNLHRARDVLSRYIFGGLFPVVSQKNALYMASEVSGISIDEAVIAAYDGLDRTQGEEMAERLCECAAKRIADDVDGYYIMTPFQRIDLVERIIRVIR